MSELNVPFLLSSMSSLDDASFYKSITSYITRIPNRYVAINVAKALNSFLYYNSTEPNTISDTEIKEAWDFFYALVRNKTAKKSRLPSVKKFTGYLIREVFSLTNLCIACGCETFPELNLPHFFKELLGTTERGPQVIKGDTRAYLQSFKKTKHFFVSLPLTLDKAVQEAVEPLRELQDCFKEPLGDRQSFNGFVNLYDYFLECLVLNLYYDEWGMNLLELPEYSVNFSSFTKENFMVGVNPISLTNFVSRFLKEEQFPPRNFVNVCSLNVYCFSNLFLRQEHLTVNELEILKGLRDYCSEMITVLLSLYGFYNETPLEIMQLV